MGSLSKLRIFSLKWVVLLCIPLIAVVTAYYFISQMDKRYKSTAQIATGFTRDDAVKLNDSPSNPFDINTNFNNIIQVMNSVKVLTFVSYRLVLHDLENEQTFRIFDPTKGDGSLSDQEIIKSRELFKDRLSKFKTLSLSDPNDQLLYRILKGYGFDHETLAKTLKIQRLEASDYISVEAISEDSFLSALIVNALCQEFIRYNKTFKTDQSSENLEILENDVKEKKKAYEEKTQALKDFRVNNNVFNSEAETKSKFAAITDLELKREQKASEIDELEISLNSVDGSIKSKSGSVKKLNQDEVVAINERIIDLKKKIDDLRNSDAPASKSRLTQLRNDLELETGRLESVNANRFDQEELNRLEKEREDLKVKVQIAQTNLANMEESIKRLRSQVSGYSTKQTSTTDLERDVNLALAEYTSAQEKYTEGKNKSAVIGSSIRQILEGQPSYEPEPTDTPLWLGMIGAGSFIVSLLGVLLVNIVDRSIRISSRLEKMTGLKNIGSVNILKSKDFNMREIFNDRSTNKEYETFSHFLRKLRYEIQSAEGKVFLITSTQVKSGKTFLIISLSYALSLISKRVLIIDTNFRHNSLTKALLPSGRGGEKKLLRKALLFQEEEDELFLEENIPRNPVSMDDDDELELQPRRNSIVNRTRFNGVDIIGNVGGRESPSEIMAGRDFKDMIKKLSARYDYVLMEGPSLNEYSDSKELIDYADKVISIFRADTSLTSMDRESIKYLKSINGRLMGTVLNNVQLKNLEIN